MVFALRDENIEKHRSSTDATPIRELMQMGSSHEKDVEKDVPKSMTSEIEELPPEELNDATQALNIHGNLVSRSTELGSAVTVTGSAYDAQVLTYSEYMQQTWPVTGIFMIQLIDDVLMLELGKTATSMASLDATLLSSMLLDLFEKFMHSGPSAIHAYTGHITGALALVKMRGLDKFAGFLPARMLTRLSVNLPISCVASVTRVPEGIILLRDYAAEQLNVQQDPKWELSDLMIHYANLRGDVLTGDLTAREQVNDTIEIDAKLHALTLRMLIS
ncbi:hypothetical protein OHC33_010980 [Knufia fluminis]|uniref:Uncharacterized protein n=1 Tax=Knufia fluminis TaxID=191047 RepID=A0AAN8EXP6_9EURO|nr:hypothetical protein OHC33_010980 [Knufia fluminis]